MLAQRNTELLTLIAVAQRVLQAGPNNADRAPGHAIAPDIQRGTSDRSQTKAPASQQVLRRNLAVIQMELGHHRGARTQEAGDRANREAWCLALQQKSGDALTVARKNQEEIGDLTIGHPFLPPLQTIALLIGNSDGLDALCIAADVRLTQAKSSYRLPRCQTREPVGSLGVVAPAQ